MLKNNILDAIMVNKTVGDIGIEIEAEMVSPFYDNNPFQKDWRIEEDGSLKQNGTEFVLRSPVKFWKVGDTIDKFKNSLKKSGAVINPSIRAGIHVHLNMQDSTIKDFYNLMLCYYPMETVLTRFCGESREGNLFCLRSRDALYIPEMIELSIRKQKLELLRTTNLRYAAFNVQSLFQYGSVEFRAFGTTPDLHNLKLWIEIIRRLKQYSKKVGNSWEILQKISGFGGRQWLVEVFGENIVSQLEYDDMENDIMEDSRDIQDVCHALSELEGKL